MTSVAVSVVVVFGGVVLSVVVVFVGVVVVGEDDFVVVVPALVFVLQFVVEGVFSVVVVLIPPVVDVTSVVVSFKKLVVVGADAVVETPGIVSLNPFVFSLARSGAAKEEERGRRNRASIIVAVVFTFGLFLNFCSLALLGGGGLLLLCQARSGIYIDRVPA